MVSTDPIVDGDLLRAFAVFASSTNFTHAAKALHLSQPAVFERVKRLEARAGVPLYERTGRALGLTEAGRKVAAFAREELARAEALAADLRGEAPRDAVTLAAGEGAYLYVLGPALERFASAAPKTLLTLSTLGAADVAGAVASGAADLGFTVLDPVPRELTSTEIVRVPMCAAIPRRHRLARLPGLLLADLARERLVTPPTGRLYRDLVARFVAMTGEELAPPLEADGWPMMLELVRRGLGVAVVNGCCAAPPGVVLRPLAELGVVRYRLLRRRGAASSAAVEMLAARISELRAVYPARS